MESASLLSNRGICKAWASVIRTGDGWTGGWGRSAAKFVRHRPKDSAADRPQRGAGTLGVEASTIGVVAKGEGALRGDLDVLLGAGCRGKHWEMASVPRQPDTSHPLTPVSRRVISDNVSSQRATWILRDLVEMRCWSASPPSQLGGALTVQLPSARFPFPGLDPLDPSSCFDPIRQAGPSLRAAEQSNKRVECLAPPVSLPRIQAWRKATLAAIGSPQGPGVVVD
jgi:hypothetical protein